MNYHDLHYNKKSTTYGNTWYISDLLNLLRAGWGSRGDRGADLREVQSHVICSWLLGIMVPSSIPSLSRCSNWLQEETWLLVPSSSWCSDWFKDKEGLLLGEDQSPSQSPPLQSFQLISIIKVLKESHCYRISLIKFKLEKKLRNAKSTKRATVNIKYQNVRVF